MQLPSLDQVVFGLLGALAVGFGIASTVAKRTFHAVMFLGVVLVAVGGLFMVLGSPLIGVLQILVYVGGILTLFVFAVMFVAGDEEEVQT
jgi:NADH-quinone oxidoreductase subunit J